MKTDIDLYFDVELYEEMANLDWEMNNANISLANEAYCIPEKEYFNEEYPEWIYK